jgi:hypothetical protein
MEMQLEKEQFQREMEDRNQELLEDQQHRLNELAEHHNQQLQNQQDQIREQVDRHNQEIMDQLNEQENENRHQIEQQIVQQLDQHHRQLERQQTEQRNGHVLPVRVLVSAPHLIRVPVAVSQAHMEKHEQNYDFGYSVNDPLTGDHKSHHERRYNDHVQGQYSLVEPDGSIRIVDYTATPEGGFKSEVRRTPQIHPATYSQVVLPTHQILHHPILATVENFIAPISRVTVTRREGPGTFTHHHTTTNHSQ